MMNVSLENYRRWHTGFMGRRTGKSLGAYAGNRDTDNDTRNRKIFIDVIEKPWQEKIIL